MNAHDMVMACFRRQHPEAYGGEEVPAAPIPQDLRYGTDAYSPPVVVAIPEEAMGHPDALPL